MKRLFVLLLVTLVLSACLGRFIAINEGVTAQWLDETAGITFTIGVLDGKMQVLEATTDKDVKLEVYSSGWDFGYDTFKWVVSHPETGEPLKYQSLFSDADTMRVKWRHQNMSGERILISVKLST